MKKKRQRRRVHHYLFPHKLNGYKPYIFSRESVATLALIMLLVQGAYLFQIKVVAKYTGFTASVLPGALIQLTNGDRTAEGLTVLEYDTLLAEAAQKKADDMAAKGYFAHTSPEGKTPWDWLKSVKYPYAYAGENLAVDFTDSKDVEQAWMNSPTHRANILKGEYSHIGIGVAQGMYQGKQVTFVAEYFASKNTATAATPPRPVVARAAEVPAKEIAKIPTEATVLGTQTEAVESTQSAYIAVAATSPRTTMLYLLVGATAFFALLLTIAVFVHIRKKYLYMEVVGGGAVLIGVALFLISYNAEMSSSVLLSDGGQAASVSSAL